MTDPFGKTRLVRNRQWGAVSLVIRRGDGVQTECNRSHGEQQGHAEVGDSDLRGRVNLQLLDPEESERACVA